MTLCLNSHSTVEDIDLLQDRGFLLGDGLFETLKVREGVTLWLEDHLTRLSDHAREFELPFPWKFEAIHQFLKPKIPDEQIYRLRLSMTAGAGGQGYMRPAEVEPRLFASFFPVLPIKSLSNLELCEEPVPENFQAKTLSGLSRILKAPPIGSEWVMVSEKGFLTECTTSNIFWVNDKKIYTPQLNSSFLPGLTRQRVIRIASELGVEVCEGDFSHEVLNRASEIFLTSSVMGVRSVEKWRGEALGNPSRCLQIQDLHETLECEQISTFK